MDRPIALKNLIEKCQTLQSYQCNEEDRLLEALFPSQASYEWDEERWQGLLLGVSHYVKFDDFKGLISDYKMSLSQRVFSLLGTLRKANSSLPFVKENDVLVGKEFQKPLTRFTEATCLVDCFWDKKKVQVTSEHPILLITTRPNKEKFDGVPDTPHLWSIVFGPRGDHLAISRTRLGPDHRHSRFSLYDSFSEWLVGSNIIDSGTWTHKSPILFALNSKIETKVNFQWAQYERKAFTDYLEEDGFKLPLLISDRNSSIGPQNDSVTVVNLTSLEESFLPSLK